MWSGRKLDHTPPSCNTFVARFFAWTQPNSPPSQAPRVNGRLIPSYDGHLVCLVGRVLQSNDQFSLLEASDKQQVRVLGGAGFGALPQQSVVEITGFALQDGSVQEQSRLEYSANFNLDTYDELVQLTTRPDLRPLFN